MTSLKNYSFTKEHKEKLRANIREENGGIMAWKINFR
jgi:hypothetical protein